MKVDHVTVANFYDLNMSFNAIRRNENFQIYSIICLFTFSFSYPFKKQKII